MHVNKWIVEVVNLIGAKMGMVQQVEDDSLWNRCIRFKVKIRVDKPLQLELFVKDSDSRRSWVYFHYEKLPEFGTRVDILNTLRRIVVGGMGNRG